MNEEKYLLAWEYVQNNQYKKSKKLFLELLELKYCKAYKDIAGFYYYGLYDFTKDTKKASYYYEKAFLCNSTKELLYEYIYVLVQNKGKILAMFHVFFNLKLLKRIISLFRTRTK